MKWSVDDIPDEGLLFMFVHKNNIKDDGSPGPGAFRNRGDEKSLAGMSTDWSRYSTPKETLQRTQNPTKNGVISMIVGLVRGLDGQTVKHTPLSENRAHTDVFGKKDDEVRIQLRRMSRWVIPFAP